MSSEHTEILCIIDRSGSMQGVADDTIGGFNSFIEKQKESEEGTASLTLVLFDDQYEVVHERVPIEDVPTLTSEIYFARGMTALNDALGKAIASLKGGLKKIPKKDRPEVICMIVTDGAENASKEYTSGHVKKLVQKREKKGWDFMFIGADIDAFDVGQRIGVQNVGTVGKGQNYGSTFSTMGSAASAKRSRKTVGNAIVGVKRERKRDPSEQHRTEARPGLVRAARS